MGGGYEMTSAVLQTALLVTVGGREFGNEAETLGLRLQKPLPPTFIDIAVAMQNDSALVALSGNVSKDEILDAYGKDVEMLNARLNDFRGFVNNIARFSIIGANQMAQNLGERVSKGLELMAKDMPVMTEGALIQLTAELYTLPEAELLEHLRGEMDRAIDRVVRTMALWLDNAVESQVVGLIDWPGGADKSACSFYYYRGDVSEHIVDRTRHIEDSKRDMSKPDGRQVTRTITEVTSTKATLRRERHTHEVVRAREHQLAAYVGEIPLFAQEFIAAIPAWLAPFCRTVDGMVVQERVHTTGSESVEETDERVVSVYEYDPAVTCGPFVLLGWGARDLAANAGSSALLSKLPAAELTKKSKNGFWLNVVVWTILAAAIYGFSCAWENFIAPHLHF
jgi:hypothetical protein